MKPMDKAAIERQLDKIRSVAAYLPPVYARSLSDAAKAITDVVQREGNDAGA